MILLFRGLIALQPTVRRQKSGRELKVECLDLESKADERKDD